MEILAIPIFPDTVWGRIGDKNDHLAGVLPPVHV